MGKLELQQFELKERDLYLFGEIDNNMSFDFIKAVNVIIQKDKESAIISATILEGSLIRKIRVLINKEGKQVFINGKPISRLSELAKCMNVILFEPKDVMLFRGSPKARRNFLDISLSKKSQPYMDYISRYDKILKERNELLKQNVIDPYLLDATTEMLVKLSGPIVSYRQMYFKDINNILNKITHALTGENGKLEVIYKPFIPYDEHFQDNALNAFKKEEEKDLKKKVLIAAINDPNSCHELLKYDIKVPFWSD